MLAIEHDWRLRRLVQANLETMGMHVRGAVSGQHALQILHEAQPDLVLIDLDSPGVDAVLLLSGLRSQVAFQHVPVLFLSDEPPSNRLKDHDSMVSYLQKPFSIAALMHHVRKALAQASGGLT